MSDDKQLSLLEEVFEQQWVEKNITHYCRSHPYAEKDDFVLVVVKSTKKEVLKCRFCEKLKYENRKIASVEWQKEKEQLSDYYIRRLLNVRGSSVPMHELPQDLIELKKVSLQLKRGIDEKNDVPTCKIHGEIPEHLRIKAGVNKSGKIRWRCKICMNAAQKRHYENNRETELEKKRQWRLLNPEKRNASKAKWYQANRNPQSERERNKRFRDRNRQLLREKQHVRRKIDVEQLRDPYLKKIIKDKYGNETLLLDKSILDLEKQLQLIKRETKKKKYT